MRQYVLPAIAGLLLTLPMTASAEVDGSDPGQIAKLLQDAGYRAQMDTAADNTPMIISSAEGVEFAIYFFGCEGGGKCTSIQYSAGFDMPDGMTYEKVNEWNSSKRFGSVHLDDEKDPYIQMDVNLDFGVSDKNFMDTFDYWRTMIKLFDDFE